MVGKTRLYQHTGSPLIRGRSKRRPALGRALPWLAAIVVLAAGVYVYLTYLR